jgi:hypothetical protein
METVTEIIIPALSTELTDDESKRVTYQFLNALEKSHTTYKGTCVKYTF